MAEPHGVLETVPDSPNFPEIEVAILNLWKEKDAFKTSLKLSEGRKEYTFYDGPPFATGLPHYGHILAGTIKDVVTRYAHQTGHHVSRRFGWDCHGLPVEFEIDKKLGIKSSDDVMEMGIAKYNAECRSIVTRYCKEWEVTVNRLGRWIDFENDYKTMEPWYMESVWWVFGEIFKKGLVYQGFRVMPYSTACNTPLSNFEANQNYQEASDPACVVSFPLVDDEDGASILAWTTTPWTLPCNLAACVHPDFTYVLINDIKSDSKYILAESRLSMLYPGMLKKKYKGGEFTILKKMIGNDLKGRKYVPLFPYFKEFSESRDNCCFRIIADTYVTDDSGTGIVHCAPAFGEDDFRVCMAQGIVFKGDKLPCPVDDNGRYTEEVPDYKGIHVKQADDKICEALKASGRLISKSTLIHSYPFCWRSDTPLIYKAVTSWFVNVESFKEDLIKANEETKWVPNFVGEKRFANWLADARDWNISRNRYWGTPLPIWISEDGKEVKVISSIAELEELSGEKITDLHRESIDHITIPSSEGKGMLRRVPEVFDCWFESGSMPYAQSHYPFENKEKFEEGFPADFIAEGLDQTRGWFYTLMVLSTALFKKPAFKNLIVNGLVLAEDGKKMSKRLKNYPPPQKCLDAYGADSLRLYLIDSPVVRAEKLRFKELGVKEVVRGKILPWYHAFRFFTENAARYGRESGTPFTNDSAIAVASTNSMDQWVLSSLNSLVGDMHTEMKAYRLYTIIPKLVLFLDSLTNWYVRLNRPRLKGNDGPEEMNTSLCVLFDVLIKLCQIMAPITPFITEFMYQHLRKLHTSLNDTSIAVDTVGRAESIHYTMLPEYEDSLNNTEIEKATEFLQSVVLLGRKARERRNISLKKPILSLTIVHHDPAVLESIRKLSGYLHSELNMEELIFDSDEAKWCKLYALPDNKALGKKLGKAFKTVKKEITKLSHADLIKYEETGSMVIGDVTLGEGDLQIKRDFNGDSTKYEAIVSDDGKLLVIVDTTETELLVKKGAVREITNKVQKLRKTAGLNVADKIEVYYAIFEVEGSSDVAGSTSFLESAIMECPDVITSVLRSTPFRPVSQLPEINEEIITEESEINGAIISLIITKPTTGVVVPSDVSVSM